MKKKYEAPVAEMVGFDYEENVVASGAQSQDSSDLSDSGSSSGYSFGIDFGMGYGFFHIGVWYGNKWHCILG